MEGVTPLSCQIIPLPEEVSNRSLFSMKSTGAAKTVWFSLPRRKRLFGEPILRA
jgi:hypothetical protein